MRKQEENDREKELKGVKERETGGWRRRRGRSSQREAIQTEAGKGYWDGIGFM